MGADMDTNPREEALAKAAVAPVREDYPLLAHYTVLIYPFIHGVTSEDRRRRIERLEERWSPWWARLGGSVHKALDDTYFFLPYIREVIYPETALLNQSPPGERYANWAEQVSQWNAKGLGYFCGELQQEAVLRLTYKSELLEAIRDIRIVPPSFGGEAEQDAMPPARFEWIDAILFPSRIGFLMLKVSLSQASPRLSQLVDLNYYLRTVHPPSTDWVLAGLRLGRVAYTVSMRDLMDFLTQGITADAPVINDITRFMEHLRHARPSRYSETQAGQVYGERCHFFSYACADVPDDAPAGGSPSGLTRKDRLLFEFAANIQVGDSQTNPVWVPSPEMVAELRARNRISVWNAWRGMALKESVVFLGTEDVGFNRAALPHNVESDYLPLYLYSLYQKYQLFVFADELMRKGAYVAEHLQEVRGLMDRFMDFRNKYWFNEVTRKPLGGELYRKFQEGLESRSLYEMVSSQVKDLKEYYEERQQRRIAALLNFFTFFFLPLSAVIGVFGMTFFEGDWRKFITAFVVVVAISLVLWRWWTTEPGPRDV